MENNKNYLGIFTIIAVIVLIVYSLFQTGYLNDNKKAKNKNTETINQPADETKNVGTLEEIVNNDVKIDLDEKIAIVNLAHGDSVRRHGTGSFYEQELYKVIFDDRLLYGLIQYLSISNDSTIKYLNQREISSYSYKYPNLIATISVSDISSKSLYYFNKDLSSVQEGPADTDEFGTAWLAFNKVEDKYLISSLGGDPSPSDMAFYYPYKYEHNNAQAFVYVSATKGAMNDKDGEIVWNIYKGFKTAEVYKSYSENEMEQYLRFQVTADNYQNFTKYKYTFDMVNGNYYFKSIERIE